MFKSKLLPFCLAIFCFLQLNAQDLPLFPPDGAYVRGVLPDGIGFCLITNPSTKGVADFALLQRVCQTQGKEFAREVLTSTPRFGKRSLQSQVCDNGAGFAEEGLIKTDDDYVLIRFRDVAVAKGEPVVDSLLLAFCDIIDQSIQRDGSVYGTNNQTIIIAGDIDQGSILNKLKALSLMIPPHTAPVAAIKPYVWASSGASCEVENGGDVARLSFTYRTSRPDAQVMGTVVPAMNDRMDDILSLIVRDRLQCAFAEANVPVAGISADHNEYRNQRGDRTFNVSFAVWPDNFDEALSIVASVLSGLDSEGSSTEEFSIARKEVDLQMTLDAVNPMENGDKVETYLGNLFCGTDLSTPAARAAFFNGKKMDDASQVKLFNSYVTSLFDPAANLNMVCSGCPDDVDNISVLVSFANAWTKPHKEFKRANLADTLGFPKPVGKKIKAQKTVTDVVTGSTVWTFDNGIRVAHKKMTTGGVCYYTLALPGGASEAADARKGEAAYYSDLMSLSKVGIHSGREFREILAYEDITMNCDVNIARTAISGAAPASNLGMLMKSLLTFSKYRENETEGLKYYLECEKLARKAETGTQAYRAAVTETKLHPDFDYSLFKTEEGLSEEMYTRAGKIIDACFTRVNRGILMLVSDRTDEDVFNQISAYISQFSVTDAMFTRKKVPFQTVSGSSMLEIPGREDGIEIASVSSMTLTTPNLVASYMAGLVLEDALKVAFKGTNWRAKAYCGFRAYPQEQIYMNLIVMPADPTGLSTKTEVKDVYSALTIVRSTLDALAAGPVPENKMAVYRAVLQSKMTQIQALPDYWLTVGEKMFLESKDYNTDIAGKAAGVPAATIQEIFAGFAKSGRLEFIIKEK